MSTFDIDRRLDVHRVLLRMQVRAAKAMEARQARQTYRMHKPFNGPSILSLTKRPFGRLSHD